VLYILQIFAIFLCFALVLIISKERNNMLRGTEHMRATTMTGELIGSLHSPVRIEKPLPDQIPLLRTGIMGYRLLAFIDYSIGTSFQQAERFGIVKATSPRSLRIPFALSRFSKDLMEIAILSQDQMGRLTDANLAGSEEEQIKLLQGLMDIGHEQTSNTDFDRLYIGHVLLDNTPIITKNLKRLDDSADRLTIMPTYSGAMLHTGQYESSEFRVHHQPGQLDYFR
jgi:hypothetical protein